MFKHLIEAKIVAVEEYSSKNDKDKNIKQIVYLEKPKTLSNGTVLKEILKVKSEVRTEQSKDPSALSIFEVRLTTYESNLFITITKQNK